jgi:hypothetical protein
MAVPSKQQRPNSTSSSPAAQFTDFLASHGAEVQLGCSRLAELPAFSPSSQLGVGIVVLPTWLYPPHVTTRGLYIHKSISFSQLQIPACACEQAHHPCKCYQALPPSRIQPSGEGDLHSDAVVEGRRKRSAVSQSTMRVLIKYRLQQRLFLITWPFEASRARCV